MSRFYYLTCDVLSGVVPFVQFRKREKHASRSISLLKVTLSFLVFFTFFKLYTWYQIAQNVLYKHAVFQGNTVIVESVVLHNSSNPT